MVTVRTFLAIAAEEIGNYIRWMFTTPFFIKIYMKLPPGFTRGKDGLVCRLKKSLYGLSRHPVVGIEVTRSQEGIFLCQRKYTLDIISESGLLGAKHATFPMKQNHHLGDSISPPLKDVERYRRLVGRLIYLTFTRPDLSFAVHILSQFMHAPRHDHWSAAIRVVRYLKVSWSMYFSELQL
ncbi:hypothetical protein LIER_36182 [Lithospermum erythrorhizon]|uniref:Mitochondrial protein n=1 Tax=Lithospermum erythrorhizon TaxID=34254 RepID=A0AAV3P3Z6_LITER